MPKISSIPTLLSLRASVLKESQSQGAVHVIKAQERSTFLRRLKIFLRRFLVPAFVVSGYYYVKYGVKVSPKAEVELSANLQFGRGAVVSSFTKIKATDGPLEIGANCSVATSCFLDAGEAGIWIGSDCLIGPNVAMSAVNYRYDELDKPLREQGMTSKGIRIGRNVWIGANCTIMDGVSIGDNCIVVANSLVTRSHPPGVIIQGNPAKIVFTRASR